jgi:hypothetical protein
MSDAEGKLNICVAPVREKDNAPKNLLRGIEDVPGTFCGWVGVSGRSRIPEGH